MFARRPSSSSSPEPGEILPSPRRESPGERASAIRPAGRGGCKANSLRRNELQNTFSVRENGRLNSPPPSLPPESKLPAPPPPKDPPPRTPPPRAPHEKDEDVERRLQTATVTSSTRKNSSKASFVPGGERYSTPPKRSPRPSSESSLELPQDHPPFRQLRVTPIIRAVITTSCASSRNTSPLRQMITARECQKSPVAHLRPSSGLSQEIFVPAITNERSTRDPSSKSSRESVISLKHPPLTEESINATAAHMILDKSRRDSSSTMSSMATSSISLPYPLIRTPQPALPTHRAASLSSSLRRARSTFLESSRNSKTWRHQHMRKRSASDSRSSGHNNSLFTRRRMNSNKRKWRSREVVFDIDDLKRLHQYRGGVAKSMMKLTSPTDMKPPGRRRKTRKGETMSMLLDDGFFPVEELVYGKEPSMNKAKNRYSSMAGFRINLPPRLSFIEMNSPLSPTSASIPGTPKTPRGDEEIPTTPRSTKNRRHVGVAQPLLPQISESEDISSDNQADTGQTSPSKSKANSETVTTKDGRSPSPGTVAPVATQIQLRNGSIVTLTPPELTPWQPTLYLHGPIKLPKPTIMPRKNSVATLDPFQDAIEKIYQNTLAIPRRRSDDAVVDDICEYFDAFGFDLISFTGDDFSNVDFGVGDVRDIAAIDTETFSTPPMEPTVILPGETAIAHEMLERIDSSQSFLFEVPPVENEETLRARGIARLSRNSANSAGATSDEGRPGRKESIILDKPPTSAVLPLLPAPETSMLDAVLQSAQRDRSYTASVYSQRHPEGGNAFANRKGRDNARVRTSRTSSGDVRMSNVDGGVEEEEMGSTERAWTGKGKTVVISPASKETKLSRMRRLVASASSIL